MTAWQIILLYTVKLTAKVDVDSLFMHHYATNFNCQTII